MYQEYIYTYRSYVSWNIYTYCLYVYTYLHTYIYIYKWMNIYECSPQHWAALRKQTKFISAVK